MPGPAAPSRQHSVGDAAGFSRWAATDIKTRRLLWLVVALCGAMSAGLAIRYAVEWRTLYPDFYGFWRFGRLAVEQSPAILYDDAAVLAFDRAGGMPPESFYPFFYPPPILLALEAVAMLPYGVARATWIALGLAAYVAALAPWRWPAPLRLALLVAPSTAVCVLVGQNGLFTAALMLAGVRLLHRRTLLAGALLGLLAYKPQFAVLVPVALLAAGQYRAIAAAGLSGAVLIGLSVAVLGPDVWLAWWSSMAGQAHALASGRGDLDDKMPTVTAAIELWGGARPLANFAQVVAALLLAWVVWRVWHRTSRAAHPGGARAVLPVAAVLATPYAFDYDLPMLTGAALAVLAEALRDRDGVAFPDLLLPLACVLAPALLMAHLGPLAPMATLLCGLLLWRLATAPTARAVA